MNAETASPARPDALILSLDCGTQSVRALLFDLQGRLLAKCQQSLDDYLSHQDGWLEHDAEAFWQAAAGVCRGLWQTHPQLKAAVKGLVVTTQRGSLVPVDAGGQALRPFIIWLDQRRASRARPMAPWWRLAFKAARVEDTIDYFSREAEINWIAEHEPEIARRTHKVLLLSGWFNYKLTGRFADSVACQVGYLPFDFKRQTWAPGWDWKWQALATTPEQMPELLPVGSTIGGLTREAAAACGLP
ncbi:MAG TPA: FGGY family carbohydrate kinase, partial [Burkholderiaceae bacterium]|nr:FGGY family carbohydrate kinase [Burkholderiaceae bacterium]